MEEEPYEREEPDVLLRVVVGAPTFPSLTFFSSLFLYSSSTEELRFSPPPHERFVVAVPVPFA
jgi:hypothetical protein